MVKIIHCYRKGSVILVVVVCAIISLLLLLGSFFRSTTRGVHTTKKLGDSILAREFANSLAVLSNHYIKNVLLKDSNSSIRNLLSMPLEKMKKEAKSKLTEDIKSKFESSLRQNFNNDSGDILTLLEKNSGLNKLEWKISWQINPAEFSSIAIDKKNIPYPREKIGTIRLNIEIKYLLPGQKTKTKEDYIFLSQIKVVANLLPVLSKFTLYVEDALDSENSDRFNIVCTSAGGKLNDKSIKPWVLNNGNKENLKTYKELIKDTRGFVYLGSENNSKPITLGIARGFDNEDTGDFGEDFHFYKKAGSDYWKTLTVLNPDKKKGVITSEIGLCDDVSNKDLKLWHEQLGAGYGGKAKLNSIFRLYGTDTNKSPTIVLGNVNSMFASIRMFKYGDNKPLALPYIDHEEDYFSGLGYSYDGLAAFASKYELLSLNNAYQEKYKKELSYPDYINKFASRLKYQRYNNDYTYIATNNTVDYPFKRGQITDSDLKKLCESNSDEIFTTVPSTDEVKYKDIYGKDLKELNKFIDETKLSISKEDSSKRKRIACYISLTNDSDLKHSKENVLETSNLEKNFIDFLEYKGFSRDKNVNLNGWLYIDNLDGINEFPLDFNGRKLVSNGGIILSKGNITIKSDILSDLSVQLTILAIDGDIIVERGVNNINASLISKEGQVKLLGDGNDSDLNIKGNIVMKKISRGNLKTNEGMKRGVFLNYNTDLSAFPYNQDVNDKIRSEFPLLMFDLREDAKMLD